MNGVMVITYTTRTHVKSIKGNLSPRRPLYQAKLRPDEWVMVITYTTRTHVKSIKATCRRGDRSTKLSYAPRGTEHDMQLKWPHAKKCIA